MKNSLIIILLLILLTASFNSGYSQEKNFSSKKLTAKTGDPDLPAFPFTPGDGLYINTFPDTNSFLNNVYAIDDRGYAEFPIVGKVKVAKMSRDELVKFIETAYRDFIPYPNIYVKPVVRISLLGGFVRPGLYYVDINNSLWDAVYIAGGTLLEEGIHDLVWERGGKEQNDELAKSFGQGISLKKMGFKSGDQLWTPSPNRRTIWDTIGDVMPVLTFATTVFMIYNTYQTNLIQIRRNY